MDGDHGLGAGLTGVAVCLAAGALRERVLDVLTPAGRPVVVGTDALARRLRGRRFAAAVVDVGAFDALVERPAPPGTAPGWAAALVLVVDHEPRRRLRAALRAGVGGVLEAERLDSLPAVLDVVRAGHLCIPDVLRRPLSRPVLSQRERQTLALATTGLTNAEIGAQLFVAPSTVKTHLSTAFQKLGVHSRSEAAALLHDPEEGLGELVLGTLRAQPRPMIGTGSWSR